MSRIGKLPIDIPAGVEVKVDGDVVTIKGAKGELQHHVPAPIAVKVEGGQVLVSRPDDQRESKALHGLTRTLLHNNIIGVSEGFSKSLQIVGTGYRAVAKGSAVEFSLGYSHTITVEPPEGITFEVEGANKVVVKGSSKQNVGEVAAKLRKLRAPEPYKGKGIRYEGEHIRRKAGKAGK
ncbi:MAG: 50S ribosomal protein L6 [Pseudoclavibacter sp.]|jgi:large subunit ribosomal protein L6